MIFLHRGRLLAGFTILLLLTLSVSKAYCLSSDSSRLRHWYGLRLTLYDAVEKNQILQGINVGLIKSQLKRTNGISLGVLGNKDGYINGFSYGTFINNSRKVNGICYSPFLTGAGQVNGIVCGGFLTYTKKINGLLLGLFADGEVVNGLSLSLAVGTDTMTGIGLSMGQSSIYAKGIFLSGFAFVKPKRSVNSSLTGAVGAAFINVDDVNGLVVGAVTVSKQHTGMAVGAVNVTKNLTGIQFGLINYAGNNPWPFRVLPLVNAHLKKE